MEAVIDSPRQRGKLQGLDCDHRAPSGGNEEVCTDQVGDGTTTIRTSAEQLHWQQLPLVIDGPIVTGGAMVPGVGDTDWHLAE